MFSVFLSILNSQLNFNLPSPLFKCDPCWLVKDCAMERRKRTSQLLLKMYSAAPKIQTLDHLRFVKYQGQIKGKSLTARIGFDLRTLSPTSDATKYHIYRTYYKVQKYLGIHVIEYQTEAPKVVLMMISFGSK